MQKAGQNRIRWWWASAVVLFLVVCALLLFRPASRGQSVHPAGAAPSGRTPAASVEAGEPGEAPRLAGSRSQPSRRPPGEPADPRRDAPEQRLLLSGRVLNLRDKSPIGTAEISIDPSTPGEGANRTFSGQDGRFSIELPRADRYEVYTRAEGYVSSRRKRVFLDGRSPLTVELIPRLQLRGRVIDANRQAVARASVRLILVESDMLDRHIGMRAFSESDGSFELLRLPGAGRYEIEVHHAHYEHEERQVTLPVEGDFLLLQIGQRYRDERMISLEGIVVDLEGRPVAGAKVTAYDNSGNRLGEQVTPDGRFKTALIRPGPTNIMARAEGYARTKRSHAYFDLDKEEASFVTLVLQRPTGLTGRVVDEGGNPIEGAMVIAAGRGMVTDEGGYFSTDEAESGLHKLVVTATDFVSFSGEVEVPYEGELEVLLERGLSLVGTVLLSDQTRVQNLQLALHDPETGKRRHQIKMVAQSGSFKVSGLEAGLYLLRLKLGVDTYEAPLVLFQSRQVRMSVDTSSGRLSIEDFGGS